MHQYPQLGPLTVLKCVKGQERFEHHMFCFCGKAVKKAAIPVTSVQVQMKWSKTERKK
jgi:hypothetical protein